MAVTNKDGSVINADGTGYDDRGDVLNKDGSITLANGITIKPDENGRLDLTKPGAYIAPAVNSANAST
jgi:hypothetical protein